MKGVIFLTILVLVSASALALQAPVTHNGLLYYKVNADDPTENTGSKVCQKIGLTCKGYTEPSTAVCKLYNPQASELTSVSGDNAGTYCDGAPQGGICATNPNTCLTCPTCTTSLGCDEEIGGLYKEAYVECTGTLPTPCPVILYATRTSDFLNEIPSLNTALSSCPVDLPSGSGFLISNGDIHGTIAMNSGTQEQITITVKNRQITGIQRGHTGSCQQKLTTAENSLDAALNTRDRGAAFMRAYSGGQISLSGCTIIKKFTNIFVSPISRWIVGRNTPPPPPPNPSCGRLGEQCNNRACATGMCASPLEWVGGRWQAQNYRCIDQRDYQNFCIGRGNTPPAWACLTSQQCSP